MKDSGASVVMNVPPSGRSLLQGDEDEREEPSRKKNATMHADEQRETAQ